MLPRSTHNVVAVLLLMVAVAVQSFLVFTLLTSRESAEARFVVTPLIWFCVHSLSSLLGAATVAWLSRLYVQSSTRGLLVLCFLLTVLLPVVGLLGSAISLVGSFRTASKKHYEDVYWKFTNNAELPFTTPIGRSVTEFDSRGYVEQLIYSRNNSDLYKKVLASRKMRAAMSVGILKKAVQHSDEKIRLTAYQTLDKKVTQLNRQIQLLENEASSMKGQQKSNTWLQIASNYWELLTLEKDEPIARRQLLEKAASAAIKSVQIMPSNRNAHFTLGRVFMMQGEAKKASLAFGKSMQLGMPKDKAMPYLAEAAFNSRDFSLVSLLLGDIDDAFKAYPPLSHVAHYWK